MNRSLVRTSAFVVVCALGDVARADPSPPVLLDTLHLPLAVLVGAAGGGHGHTHGHAMRVPHGWFFGADTGVAWLFGPSDVAVRAASSGTSYAPAWCFGARAGYQLASGLAVQARFDRLGVAAPDGSGEVVAASAGVRYSFPLVPMPFAEALVGPVIHGSEVSPAVALGVGVSFLVARHLAFDASIRDWIVDLDGIHHVPTMMLGISAGFGG